MACVEVQSEDRDCPTPGAATGQDLSAEGERRRGAGGAGVGRNPAWHIFTEYSEFPTARSCHAASIDRAADAMRHRIAEGCKCHEDFPELSACCCCNYRICRLGYSSPCAGSSSSQNSSSSSPAVAPAAPDSTRPAYKPGFFLPDIRGL